MKEGFLREKGRFICDSPLEVGWKDGFGEMGARSRDSGRNETHGKRRKSSAKERR